MEPNFSVISPSKARQYQSFYEKSTPEALKKNVNLTELSRLFSQNTQLALRVNPYLDLWKHKHGDPKMVNEAWQWIIDRVSDMKKRLSNAIVYKTNYYENHWLGKITRCFLKIFGMWNNGITPAIEEAETQLFEFDTRCSLFKNCRNQYEERDFMFFLMSTASINQNYNTKNFFNYDPQRRIPLTKNRFWNNGKIENN